MSPKTFFIDTPYLSAMVKLKNNIVYAVDGEFSFFKGMSEDQMKTYCISAGYKLREIGEWPYCDENPVKRSFS